MFNCKFTILCLAIILLIVNLPVASFGSDQQKKVVSEKPKRVAVLPFSFHNPNDEASDEARDDVGDVDVGAEIAKVLSARIAKMPGWTSVSQEDVSALLQRDDTADLSGVELGKALNADAIITGTVQTFEFQPMDNTSAAAASTAASAAATAAYAASSYVPYVGSVAGLLNIVPSSDSEHGHAKVVVDATLTDVDSGKDISTFNGTATSRKKATNLWGEGNEPNADFLSESFANCIAGQATFATLDAICKQLALTAPQVDTLVANRVQGMITDVDNNLICVNVGKTDGFKVGDKFIVERESSTPSDQTTTRVGVISITDIGDQASLAKLVDGTTPFIGDDIRNEAASSTNK